MNGKKSKKLRRAARVIAYMEKKPATDVEVIYKKLKSDKAYAEERVK